MKKIILLFVVSVFMFVFTFPLHARVNDRKDTPLITAVKQNNVDEINKLLAAGADVNAMNKIYWSPLHYAVQNDNLKVAKLLIKNGADVNAHSDESETPLYLAVINNNDKMVKLLISNGADVNISLSSWTPLFHAVLNENKKVAILLIKNGADVNQTIAGGPIIAAAFACPNEGPCNLKDRESILKTMLKYGADINAKGDDGKTPLDYVDKEEIKQILIKYGAKSGKDLK